MKCRNKCKGARQSSINVNGNDLPAACQVLENISKCPKPEHIADDMPHAVVVKHVGDQCPRLSCQFMKAGWQREIIINIVAKVHIGGRLIVTDIINDFYKCKQNENDQVDRDQH